ncbi:hypothetical protein EVAR_11954_1 [Eumeta japonica]|uniref:Uncharacterized protein n=1 Tax=Eumeta variegata TaxID=151549 RepID=A0A4C1U4N5_EUMVA|nr:hypothetical protein EVAR_11954_1 [Eumeta japonica]
MNFSARGKSEKQCRGSPSTAGLTRLSEAALARGSKTVKKITSMFIECNRQWPAALARSSVHEVEVVPHCDVQFVVRD